MVPEGWKESVFGEAFNIKTGIGFKYAEYADEGIPLVKIDNVSHGYIKWENISYLPEDYLVQHADLILKEGDIVVALNRPITQGKLKIARIQAGDFPSILYQRVGKIYPITDKTNQDYFYYGLEPLIFKFVKRKSIGSDQPFISTTELKKIKLLIPPLPEQKKIAQILSTWDKAITTTEQLLANSQQQKKALMQQLLTGKKRLLDDNGIRFSGKWKSYHLSELTKVVMGSSPKSAAYNEVELGLPLLQGNADIKNRRSAPRIYTSEITRECEVNDILLSVRAPVGTVALSNHHACIGRGIAAIRAKENTNQDFIYQWLLWFEPKWSSLSQGSTFESINSADIKQLKVKSPEYKEQQKIAAVLISADHEIDSLQQKIEVLKQEKKALMQQLLTGKRRVKP